MLLNREGSDIRYIERISYYTEKMANEPTAAPKASSAAPTAPAEPKDEKESDPIFAAVMNGEKDSIVPLTKERVEGGATPSEIINDLLIPAINKVGKLFEQKRYFLPQLIASAGAMEQSIAYLEPMLVSDGQDDDAPVVVIATVEGDVHDIGVVREHHLIHSLQLSLRHRNHLLRRQRSCCHASFFCSRSACKE